MIPKTIKVKKKSDKPFKSGLLVNTVKDIAINQKDPKKRHAYVFYEDDSMVNVDACEILNI